MTIGGFKRPAAPRPATGAFGLGRALALALVRALLISWLFSLAAAAAEYHRFADSAPWVDVLEPAYDARATSSTGSGAFALLLDRQLRVQHGGDDYYLHVAFKITDAVGVEEFSNVDLEVDPAYQSLEIHRLRVVRQGAVIDHRQTARITELRQESDLEALVYNGRYNVNILLPDVRVGDVVEYAYTRRSRNLHFPEHYAARLDIGWSVPVHRQRIRVLAPVEKPLRFRSSGGTPLPEAVERGAVREFLLDSSAVPAVAADALAPHWFEAWPYVEVSDLEDWRSVAGLVEPLFRVPAAPGPRVAALIATLRSAGGPLEQQALRALQYVQEELRYTSLSIGRGSMEPTDSEVVLERRFGDCKDKSLLLAAVLRGLGVDASVALVHTTRGRSLDAALPTPYAFDHAIVRARVGGRTYWLDPTAAKQHAPLGESYAASYERALVASEERTTGLAVIPAPAPDARRKLVAVQLDLTAGVEAPATLDVTTQFQGAFADAMRPAVARGNPEQRQTDYEAYIARYYPSARARAPLELRDDVVNNMLDIHERYVLDSAFVRNGEGTLELALHPDELYAYAEPLGAGARRAPLALEYPLRLQQTIRARLPDDWPVSPGTFSVENPAFRYSSEVRYSDRTLYLIYQYEALADHVPVDALAQFEADRARAYADMGYVLTTFGGFATGDIAVAPLPLLAMLGALALAVWGAVRYGYRYDPEPFAAPQGAPSGIRGWLLLPAISVVASPCFVVALMVIWTPFMEAGVWRNLPSVVAEGYESSVQYGVAAIIAGTAVLAVASVLVLVLFFKKRSSLPRCYIALTWAMLAFGTGFAWWAMVIGLDKETSWVTLGAETFRTGVVSVIWTAYMLSSRRVAATFVRRHAVHHALDNAPAVATAASAAPAS